MVPALLRSTGLSSCALLLAATACAASAPPGPARPAACDSASGAVCEYGPAPLTVPLNGFKAVPWDDEAVQGDALPWGGKWQRGDELVWISKSRTPDYPVVEGGFRLRVEAVRACQGQVPGVRKSFTLPPMDTPTTAIVQFFTLDGRAYQVGYARPSRYKPSKDALDFISRYCGG